MHTFHMVSLFGRTVFANKMTFDPSTTLVRSLELSLTPQLSAGEGFLSLGQISAIPRRLICMKSRGFALSKPPLSDANVAQHPGALPSCNHADSDV